MKITDVQNEILKLKKEKDIYILAHTYQCPDILDIADLTGDSFALSAAAASVSQKTVLMCGVRFMAETVKILSPQKTVILSNKDAGCPMAEQLSVNEILEYRQKNPTHAVVAYINTTAELKTVSDVCVTSSSALQIVGALPEKDILFIPDKNLGAFVQKMLPQKNIHTLEGCCPVHDMVTKEDVIKAKSKYPNALFAVHPECKSEVCDIADFIGSTTEIIDYMKKSDKQVIIGTERGVVDYLERETKNKYIQLCKEKLTCEDMKKTTLQDVYNAISGNNPCIIEMDEELRKEAKKPIDRMLLIGLSAKS